MDGATPQATGAETSDASRSPSQEQAEVRTEALLALVLGSLEDDKAEDVLSIDLRGKSSLADYMVIASGRSNRHVGSICDKLIERLKKAVGRSPRAEGVEHGDWALIDASDVIVHVFRPEVRAFYALEKMWAPADVVAARDAKATAERDAAERDAADGDAAR